MSRPSPTKLAKYYVGKDDLVTVNNRDLRYAEEFDEGIVFRPNDDTGNVTPIVYKWNTLSELIASGVATVDTGYFTEKRAIERARNVKSFELDPEKVLRAKMVAEFLSQEDVYAAWSPEKCHRSDQDIKRFYAIFKAEKDNEALIEEARISMTKKGKKKLFVGPRQFRRLIKRFEDSELRPSSMADRYHGGGSPGSTLDQRDLEFALEFVNKARTPDAPTVLSAYILMNWENEKLKAAGKAGHRKISLSTFQRMTSEESDFVNDVGRNDTKHPVERKYLFKKRGLQVTRPLEIVEMDEHQVHLMTMLTKNGLWNYIDPSAQIKIKAMGRVWLSVALDAFSRSVVGMKILKGAPDSDAAVATLAMVAQRKDKISALLGAQTGWPQCGTPGAVHTDAGAAYVSAKFELAVMMFSGKHRIPPSKHPHLRGRIERFFRTINQSYIHLFSGQTFSNPLMKGEYDPKKYAHVTDEEFADLIARLIIDCYHNTKHRALHMTPLDAWYRGSQLQNGAILPPPSPDKYREIFGTTIKRSIGNSGIDIAGNIYSSAELLEIRKKWYRAKLLVRMNEDDIHTISVKHRRLNKWIEVPAVFDGLKGVSLDEWRETVRYMDRHLGTKKLHAQDAVRSCLKIVREVLALSKQRSGVLIHDSLEKKLDRFEKEFGFKQRYNQDQNFDYAAWDDGIDYEDQEDDDDEEFAAGRLSARLKARPPEERTIERIDTAGSALNPGAGVQRFDRSAFGANEDRLPAPRDQSTRISKSSKVTRPVAPTHDNNDRTQPDAAQEQAKAAVPEAPEAKARRPIRVTGMPKKEDRQ